MSAKRRLAKVAATLTPTELIVGWLEEAHAFPDLATYVRALLAEAPSQQPGDRLAHAAVDGAIAAARSKRPEPWTPRRTAPCGRPSFAMSSSCGSPR
jgi:hypothetical protein